MQVVSSHQQVPVYAIEPDGLTGNRRFKMYNFEGSLPDQSELLIPHRKSHYLIVFIRNASGTRQWIDMEPYILQDNTIYFSSPPNIIVKEEFKQLWSTGIAFTGEFLSFQENAALSQLPIIQNPHNCHELLLTKEDVNFVEEMITKLNAEYRRPGEWQQQMLTAYLTVLLTYLSRLYNEQFSHEGPSTEKLLLKRFQEKINAHYRELHEVSEYASQLNMSAGHLSEVVKVQSGKPAIKHIHDRLIMEARRLLFHTNNSLKEISFDLGFTDASYFNRFFKRETGITPADYRASIRKMSY
ncbi:MULTISPECIES: helix-turn-helix domain-containing protein [Niastella]|uniref:Helix-turn-helix domain-containing protein n=1 Tax=Niastella soli TaxID=2821487 RepID=A0ABS3Z5N0_9BACT|nr:AraC family transcriptional regulator [Niastella soli]MBO9205444.1 helix-turn-helix domain-containing protein [Niastella soli]